MPSRRPLKGEEPPIAVNVRVKRVIRNKMPRDFFSAIQRALHLSRPSPSSTSRPPAPRPSVPPKVNAIYYPNWIIEEKRNNQLQTPSLLLDSLLEDRLVTHIFYAFAAIDADQCRLVSSNPYLDFEIEVDGGRGCMAGVVNRVRQANLQHVANGGDRTGCPGPDIKVILSVGGGDGSVSCRKFYEVTRDVEKRLKFCDSVREMVDLWGFNGVDVDWEHPATLAETRSYISLLHDLRVALPRSEGYIVTTAVSAALWALENMAITEAAQCVDFVNLMGYDFYGPWGDYEVGHCSALLSPTFKNKPEAERVAPSVNHGIRYMIEDCKVPSNKIVVGVPCYGRKFPRCSNLLNKVQKSRRAEIEGEKGVIQYRDLPRHGLIEEVEEEEDMSDAARKANDEGLKRVKRRYRWTEGYQEFVCAGFMFRHLLPESNSETDATGLEEDSAIVRGTYGDEANRTEAAGANETKQEAPYRPVTNGTTGNKTTNTDAASLPHETDQVCSSVPTNPTSPVQPSNSSNSASLTNGLTTASGLDSAPPNDPLTSSNIPKSSKPDFISMDVIKSVHRKADYVKKNGLAGLFFWTVAGDVTHDQDTAISQGHKTFGISARGLEKSNYDDKDDEENSATKFPPLDPKRRYKRNWDAWAAKDHDYIGRAVVKGRGSLIREGARALGVGCRRGILRSGEAGKRSALSSVVSSRRGSDDEEDWPPPVAAPKEVHRAWWARKEEKDKERASQMRETREEERRKGLEEELLKLKEAKVEQSDNVVVAGIGQGDEHNDEDPDRVDNGEGNPEKSKDDDEDMYGP